MYIHARALTLRAGAEPEEPREPPAEILSRNLAALSERDLLELAEVLKKEMVRHHFRIGSHSHSIYRRSAASLLRMRLRCTYLSALARES